jgi:hypothetical protein
LALLFAAGGGGGRVPFVAGSEMLLFDILMAFDFELGA